MAAAPRGRTDAVTKTARERSVIGASVETDAQYLTLEQQLADDAAADLDVAWRQVKLLQYRARGHPAPPTTVQEYHFRAAREAQSTSEIQNLLTKAETALEEATDKWNRITRTRTMKNELRKMKLEEKTRYERALSREILDRMTDLHSDTNPVGLLSESGGSNPDSVSVALRAAYRASTNERVPCADCALENDGHHAAATTIDGATRIPSVNQNSRAMEGCNGAAGRDGFRGDALDGGRGAASAGRGGGRRRRRRRATQLVALPFDASLATEPPADLMSSRRPPLPHLRQRGVAGNVGPPASIGRDFRAAAVDERAAA